MIKSKPVLKLYIVIGKYTILWQVRLATSRHLLSYSWPFIKFDCWILSFTYPNYFLYYGAPVIKLAEMIFMYVLSLFLQELSFNLPRKYFCYKMSVMIKDYVLEKKPFPKEHAVVSHAMMVMEEVELVTGQNLNFHFYLKAFKEKLNFWNEGIKKNRCLNYLRLTKQLFLCPFSLSLSPLHISNSSQYLHLHISNSSTRSLSG